jgi:hypothetical protein
MKSILSHWQPRRRSLNSTTISTKLASAPSKLESPSIPLKPFRDRIFNINSSKGHFRRFSGSSVIPSSAVLTSIEKIDPYKLSHHPTNPYRLPLSPTAIHYDIYIKTYLKNEELRFQGFSEVEIELTYESEGILIHLGKDLELLGESIRIQSLSDGKIYKGTFDFDEKLERVKFRLEGGQKFQPGRWKIGVAFQSELLSSMMGYYKSSYNLENGEKAYYALSQFEATACRRAFVSAFPQ